MSDHYDGLVLEPGPMFPSTPLDTWMALILVAFIAYWVWRILWPGGRFVAWTIVTGLMVATTLITFPDAAQTAFGAPYWVTWVAAAAVVVMMASSLRATPSTAASATATHEAEGADPTVAGHQTHLAPTEPSTWLSGKGINHADH